MNSQLWFNSIQSIKLINKFNWDHSTTHTHTCPRRTATPRSCPSPRSADWCRLSSCVTSRLWNRAVKFSGRQWAHNFGMFDKVRTYRQNVSWRSKQTTQFGSVSGSANLNCSIGPNLKVRTNGKVYCEEPKEPSNLALYLVRQTKIVVSVLTLMFDHFVWCLNCLMLKSPSINGKLFVTVVQRFSPQHVWQFWPGYLF